MILTLKAPIVTALKTDLARLHIFEIDKDGDIVYKKNGRRHNFNYEKEAELDLSALTKGETQNLVTLLETAKVHGCKVAASDVKKYLRASEEGVENVRARTCRQAAWMLEHFFARLPHHAIFSRDQYGGNSYSGYYVGDVDFEPTKPGTSSRDRQEEYCQIDLWHIENDCRKSGGLRLHRGDVLEMTCLEILDGMGYVSETPRLMERLRTETELFYKRSEQIGLQCKAVGLGLVDLDDASESSDRGYGRNKIKLDHFGESRVVVDVYQETDKEERSGRGGGEVDPYRWHNWNMRFHTPSEDEIVRHLEADEDTAEPTDVDIPVHPLVPCYDLKRHKRLRIHVNNLTPYQYDKNVSERLVLPDRDWKMVNLLVDHSSNEFNDIVANKGQSMNVLSVGIPGTGKTATAEVFAEFKERPLYTIQCSQLGLDADQVEKNLSIIMMRANRWNAVLLLDEADVYIRKRGTDLNQNAIVGAFLRVLEYASCILFMTTNLEDSVDDAITSRCIARLHYGPPGPENQSKIWRILSGLNGLTMTLEEIKKVTTRHPNLTGRDVKNLLKLASFAKADKMIDAEAVEYALQFKPTE